MFNQVIMAKQENNLFVGDKLTLFLEYLREKKGLDKYKVSDFCKEYNLSYGSWVRVFRNDTKLGTTLLVVLINYFPYLNYNWLFLDRGPMIQEETEFIKEEKIETDLNKTVLELQNKIDIINKHLKL